MQPAGPSPTALLTAVGRWSHRSQEQPWVFDDPLGVLLVGPDWMAAREGYGAALPPDVYAEAVGGILARARVAEDRLGAGSFTQYVILGAGLDTFAWRRPDLLSRLRCFEVDHPATQVWKQQRAAALGLPVHENHRFTPVDFETETLRSGLDAAGFDWSTPTLFSWLGVTPYLTRSAIEETLATIRGCGPTTEVVMTYGTAGPSLDDIGRQFLDILTRVAAAGGEAVETLLTREEAESLVVGCGFEVIDHPTRDELVSRYFAGRSDGLRPYTNEGILTARVC